MSRLFDSSDKFVIIYSSDTDINDEGQASHVRHRKFTRWVNENKIEWELVKQLENRYPFVSDTKTGSFADFFMYAKSKRPHRSGRK